MPIVNIIKITIYLLTDILMSFAIYRKTKTKLIKVLCIKLDGIGDYVLWLNSARAMQQLFPPISHSVTLISNSVWEQLAKNTNVFNDVIGLDIKKFTEDIFYRYRVAKYLRSSNFDIVINPTYSRKMFLDDSIVRMTCAPIAIGIVGDRINTGLIGQKIANIWYTQLVFTGGPNLMELIRNAVFMRHLGLTHFKARLPKLESFYICSNKVKQRYYLILPGAGIAVKRWPASRFAEISERMFKYDNSLQGIVCGDFNDIDICNEICKKSTAPLINSCAEITISELVEIITGAELLIGNDTGAVHIAASVGTPTVCILGAGECGRFLPYKVEDGEIPSSFYCVTSFPECAGCHWYCKFVDYRIQSAPCVLAITVEAVWNQVLVIVSSPEIDF